MRTLRESVFQYALVWRSSIPIYGRHATEENDHKLLEMIQHKPVYVAPPWLQQMLLHMHKYDYTIWYKPDKDMVLTDCLSHFPSLVNSLPIPTVHNVQHVQLSKAELDIIQVSVECDLVYSTIYCLTLRGLPEQRQKFPTLPDIFGVPGTNCPSIQPFSSGGQESAFPWSSSTTPLLICMEPIRVLIGCRPR